MTEFILLGLGSIFLPLLIFNWFNRQTHLVYQGEVQISTSGLLPELRSSQVPYDFVTVFLPDQTTQVAELSKERLARLKQTGNIVVKANACVSRSFSGKPYISGLQLPGEESMHVEKGDSALYLSVAYLLIAMLSFTFVFNPTAQSEVGAIAAILPAVLATLSGYVLGRHKLPSLTTDSRSTFIYFIPMGSGKVGVAMISVLALAITAATFYYGGLLFLLGLNTAVAFGMMLALLAKPYAKS